MRWRIGRPGESCVEPRTQIPMHKQKERQQVDTAQEVPADAAAQLQELQQQDGHECCPNLNARGVGTDARNVLDFEACSSALKNGPICQICFLRAAMVT